MVRGIMENNCDLITHGVKRQLSVYEKATIVAKNKALVLPGYPPRAEGNRGEIEELLAVGFAANNIIGVEHNPAIAEECYDHYYDRIMIHCDDIGEYLSRSYQRFSYMHLDFCAQFNEDVLKATQRWSGHLDPVARVRVSTTATRRGQVHMGYETALRRQLVLPLLAAAKLRDRADAARWESYAEAIVTSTDSTQLLAVVMVLNFFFGMQAWVYADMSLAKPHWPEPKGTHLVTNIERFSYYEVGGKTHMFTIWADLVPLQVHTIPDVDWITGYLKGFFSTVANPAPQFNPEVFYRDPPEPAGGHEA